MDYIKIKRFVVFCYDSSVDYDNCKTNIKYQQEKSKPSWGPTCPGDLPLPPAGPTNLPTPGGWSLAAIWVTTYFLQSWGQLLKGRLLWRNLRLLQPRREPTLGRVWGLFPQPSTAWSPRRSPRPAGWQSWWPPRWGRWSCWRGCQDRSGIFCFGGRVQSSPSHLTIITSDQFDCAEPAPQSLDQTFQPLETRKETCWTQTCQKTSLDGIVFLILNNVI